MIKVPLRALGSARVGRMRGMLALSTAVIASLGMVLASTALAAEKPEWVITSHASPTNLPPGGSGQIVVTAVNVGGAASDGSTITIADTLPSGLVAEEATGYSVYAAGPISTNFFHKPASQMSCATGAEIVCTYGNVVQPGDQLVVTVTVAVEAGASASVMNHARVSGGGVPESAVSSAVSVSGEQAGFGLAPGSVFAALSAHRAGAHADVTTGFAMDTASPITSAGDPKNVSFTLPPGAVGNTVGMPRCTASLAFHRNCPRDTIVGVASIEYSVLGILTVRAVLPIYNIAPSPGEPAAFAFQIASSPVRLDTSVLSDGDYAVRVTAGNISQTFPLLASFITVWGVPADHQGAGSIPVIGDEKAGVESVGAPNPAVTRVPLLSNPTQCSTPLIAFAEADAWRNPGVFKTVQASMGSLDGCLEVPFSSSFSLLPDTLEAGAPAGYRFHLRVPQVNDPDAPATSNVRSVRVTLPEGVVVNPSAAWGLKACSPLEFYGPDHPSQKPAGFAKCPREAQVGTVSVKTPALEEALEGQVYLAEPGCDPCSPQDAEEGKMVRLYVQLFSEGEGGIVVKLEGRASIDQRTGRITTLFEENPQLPFDEFKLDLTGGPRAVLANPRQCGTVRATGDLRPWSSVLAAGEGGLISDSQPFYDFEINQNCFSPQFSPTVKAGSPSIQAGGYSPFTLAFGRADNDQFLGGVALTMPPGLLGNIGSVVQCKEPEASQGSCGAGSLIGHVNVLTGPGANPFLVTGGQVFLTEGYKGAPYGLSIVVPAVAGPYTLSGTTGHGTVVVRAKIQVDPIDAHLTVTSDPLPSMLDGIPLQLQVVNAVIDKPGFTFNPTNCSKMAIAAHLTSTEGMSADRSSPFQVTNCANLKFTPRFSVSTTGKTSKANGAGLSVKLAYPSGSMGSQANIGRVKVELPKQLPSRLTTLQKACLASTFEANPANCPSQSIVGHAKVITPILPVPLEGPAYFVSHGGQAFPNLTIVLQGYGVTVQLVGDTFISKAGITSSTFKTAPDVPFNTFELTLPQGPYSALTANGNLCTSKLRMPTEFVAQNGALVTQNTPIAVTGCAKTKALTHAQKLARALKACHKKPKGAKRKACERQVRRRYGPHGKKK